MDSTLTGLTEIVTPGVDDLLYIVSSGGDRKVKAQNLSAALPVASGVSKGLMSAADKASFDQAIVDISTLKTPLVATVATAATVTLPANTFEIILTGTVNVTVLAGLINYRTYIFFYPTGAGFTFMGLNMQAGDVYQFTQTP